MAQIELPHRHGEGGETALLQEQLDRTGHFQMIAEVFRHLGDPTRVRLFWLLCHCEECVLNLSAMMEMSSPALSHHLRALKTSGLIVSRRDGKEVYYRAADSAQSQLLHRMIEQVMEITCPREQADAPEQMQNGKMLDTQPVPEEMPAELLEIVRNVHEELLVHMDRRITIEELSKRYLINPTTLKTAFKDVYGTSIAAHIKEHRMERAAELLRESKQPIAEIAQAVGYDSQSKFSAAFKSYYQVLPKEYRKGEAREDK